jgi:hypothetical protein
LSGPSTEEKNMTQTKLRRASAAVIAAGLFALAGCLPGQLNEAISKISRQNRALSDLAHDVKKALRKKDMDPAEASKAYGAYVSALAQFSELVINASTADKAPAKAASIVADVASSRDAFVALAKDTLVKTGKEKWLKGVPAFDLDPAQIWSAYMAMPASDREGAVEAVTGKLTMTPWDDL